MDERRDPGHSVAPVIAVEFDDFAVEFVELYNDPTQQPVITTRLQWWYVLGAIQLASRHPAARTSPVLQSAIRFAEALQAYIATTPALARVAEQGWDQTLDD